MPIIKSAKKRVRIAKKATARNVKTKRSFRSAIKDFREKKATKAGAEALSEAQATIDTAVKKGVLHKNTAARKKRQLAAEAKEAGVKLSTKKKTTTTKKPAAKKPAAKKPAAKTPAKKTTATKKSTPAKKK